MHSRNGNGWGGVFGSEDLATDHERTDPEMEVPVDAAPTVPPRSAGGKKLRLPNPNSDPYAPSPSGLKPQTPAPSATSKPSFDSEELMGKLDRTESASPKEEARLLTKEVVLTVVAGVLLLAGALGYNWYSNQQEAAAKPAITKKKFSEPAKLVKPAPPPVVDAVPAKAKEPVVVPKPAKAAIAIVSILSTPSGATVEIDGTIYGKTPLIEKLPNGPPALSIRLMKDNYRKYEAVVRKNDAGHYNLNARLDPASSR